MLKGGVTSTYNYKFVTESIGTNETCDVTPSKGTKGETKFDIVCSYNKDSNFMYEFYDKTSEEADEKTIFNGRMLGTTYRGALHEVKLTRGNVVVYLINSQNGLTLSKRVSVTLGELKKIHRLYFQQVDAPPTLNLLITDASNEKFGDGWIGLQGVQT
ncbi:hypothetical protein J6590_076395 [Homalodisca vitripennis]|nr:hypothetical protein J6590_076395 [Homalodisca vitripennis]